MALTILIIDDDPSFRHLAELRLKQIDPKSSFTVLENLADAREFLENYECNFDLVILDQHLPDGRGLDLLKEGRFNDVSVIAVSSDDNPEMPGATIKAGATYFLNKIHISEPLFKPLVQGILDRNRLFRELAATRIEAAKVETVRTLVGTLRHEIHNVTPEMKNAAQIIDSSGKRIQEVLQKLCEAVSLESVKKADEKLFHIPGDKRWDDK